MIVHAKVGKGDIIMGNSIRHKWIKVLIMCNKFLTCFNYLSVSVIRLLINFRPLSIKYEDGTYKWRHHVTCYQFVSSSSKLSFPAYTSRRNKAKGISKKISRNISTEVVCRKDAARVRRGQKVLFTLITFLRMCS